MPRPDLSHVAVEILVTLAVGPRHGYAIKLDIERRVGGDFILGSGSLYQALHRLERRGLVAVVDAEHSTDGRRGAVYRIEPDGRRVLDSELARMQRVLTQVPRRLVPVPEGRT